VWWEFVAAIVTAVGSIAGSVWVVRAVVRHELKACEERLEAYKQGLAHGEDEDRDYGHDRGP
jgi:hypothetical protein